MVQVLIEEKIINNLIPITSFVYVVMITIEDICFYVEVIININKILIKILLKVNVIVNLIYY